MTNSSSALERVYNECFDEETTMLRRRRENDKSLSLDTLESTLRALYKIDGDNWEGRSAVAEQRLNAQIDAYEKFIHEWKKDCGGRET